VIGYAGAFLGGILSLLSPCSVMLLPAFFAYAFASPTKIIGRTGLFFAGLLVTLVPLGVLAGVVGSFVIDNRTTIVAIAAAVVILIGVVQLLGLPLPGFTRGVGGEGTSAISVFVLGTVYGVAGVCAGPILGSVLTVAAFGGNPAYGGMLLALYAFGMVVPLGILALVWTRMQSARKSWFRPRELRLGRWRNSWWTIASGVLSIAIGVLLLLTEGTAGLGGILTIDAQYATENWVTTAASGISNLVFGLLALGVLGVIALLYFRRSRRAD
jgi:cytochrome c biogenesis protein CcdA